MPAIASVAKQCPPYHMTQKETEEIIRDIFYESFPDMDRLLRVFGNGGIQSRQFAVPKQWFTQEHSFKDRNDLYIKEATNLATEAVKSCLSNEQFLKVPTDYEDIDAIIFISSSGIATPTIEARMMNRLPFSTQTKRIPIWGLGCAGGAAGISRAYEYCLAYPDAKVLVVSVELSSLSFQRHDDRKSNFVGTSLFSDGVACALVIGDEVKMTEDLNQRSLPFILGTRSVLMRNAEDVMGWDIQNDGFHVIFSRDIPSIIRDWLKPNVEAFLHEYGIDIGDISRLVAHPGGKKVLKAYEDALGYDESMTANAREVLAQHGNMSSPTVLYVLQKTMLGAPNHGEYGLMMALGPGFSAECVLLEWRQVS
ncbi:type III polyketide synthase [Texcoconibacillus texcoconensis]|uniref:Alkylresorcinol/alkylpyrone synthase n=1 Tax=Texcoconibacillus texcoconensis TaxID=1095777 RepID=A0A840QML3_9BACI|nr:3-oxoacyl-[acyl-carrier-protein] synthase III C-terminal domain-containing protein [Texcoconibacillus texcoconensis]MBB5172570.1 alkylresorcinol/alkylpyrone synthase [Texcoconibacillus texcoconensis]